MDYKAKLNLNSLNVRGINNEKKRKLIFQWLKQQYPGIILLQETHSTSSDEALWAKEWGNEIIYSHGTNNSRGVAILVWSKHNYNISNVVRDNDGRFLLIELEINEEKYVIINLYAPTKNQTIAQKEFYALLDDKLKEYTSHNIIIGGDFNVCMNPEVDKYGGIKEPVSNSSKQIHNLRETHDLIDIWRSLNENARRYTWRNMTKRGRVASRLDYWLISSHLLFNTDDTKIEPSIKTDHSIITLSIFLKKSPSRGRGFWKFNNSLLVEKQYIQIVESFLDNCAEQYRGIENKALVWDSMKCAIRGLTIEYSIKRAKENRQYKNNLQAELKQLENRLDKHEDVGDIYNTIRRELEQIEEEQLRGNIIRSRAQWIEEGERCSKYFMQLENRNYKSKCITCLTTKAQGRLDDQNDILHECKSFYEDLYSERKANLDFDHSGIFNTVHNTLDEIEKEICEGKVSMEECYDSLHQFPNNKSPGSDGLSIEFYKYFWNKISPFLMDSYNYSFENNILSVDQRRALLILIPKSEKDKRLLTNWRPISLLNSDYKILAKVLANRLQKVISTIVHADQVGYVKGRNIGDNIRTLLDILDITKHKSDPGMLVMIDFEKAFDTVSWKFLHQTLQYFNFGPTFIQYIKLLYTEAECSVTNNGYHTEFFKISRGIRQGCPISALLFILCVEVMAIKIREDNNIKGITVMDKELKITQYADDTCLYVDSIVSLENALQVFEDFYRYAGLRLNIDKTKAIWLGTNSRIGKVCNITLTNTPVKVLGIWICKNHDQMLDINYTERLGKLKTILNMWSQRQLTIKGKILLLKAKAIPLITYVCNFLHVTTDTIKQIETMLYNFVWNNKHHVKKTTLIQNTSAGGLNMPDIKSIIKSIKINFIKRLVDNDTNCNKTASTILKTKDVTKFLSFKNNTGFLHELPPYYKQLLDMWYSVHNTKPTLTEDILIENIWYNENILIGNKPVFNKQWSMAGINFIQDLLHNKEFITKEQLETKYAIRCDFLFYIGLKAAIPKSWIEKIHQNNSAEHIHTEPCNLTVQIENKCVDIRRVRCKQLYMAEIERLAERPTCYYKWESNYYYSTFDWNLINIIPYRCTSETYLQSLQYKIIHRYFPCNYNLHIWNVNNNDKCNDCDEVDTLSHYFVECNKLCIFWKRLKSWFLKNFEFLINFTSLDVLLGIPNHNKQTEIDILNFILLFSKNYIYSSKKVCKQIDFYTFQVKLKTQIEIEKYRCKMYNKLDEFTRKWKLIADAV